MLTGDALSVVDDQQLTAFRAFAKRETNLARPQIVSVLNDLDQSLKRLDVQVLGGRGRTAHHLLDGARRGREGIRKTKHDSCRELWRPWVDDLVYATFIFPY